MEPLVVSPVGDGKFLLLDGAIRLDILKERNELEVRCIVSTDDEGYTYNKRVNQLSNIGEHYMILKALSNGVSEQDISVSLSVDVETIRRKRSMLDGICKEAVELLTNRRVAVQTYGILRKMKPLGQIQAAERIIHANSYSTSMAKALLTITKPELLVSPEKLSRSSPGSSAKLEVLRQESEALLTELNKWRSPMPPKRSTSLSASDTWSIGWPARVSRSTWRNITLNSSMNSINCRRKVRRDVTHDYCPVKKTAATEKSVAKKSVKVA